MPNPQPNISGNLFFLLKFWAKAFTFLVIFTLKFKKVKVLDFYRILKIMFSFCTLHVGHRANTGNKQGIKSLWKQIIRYRKGSNMLKLLLYKFSWRQEGNEKPVTTG